MTYVTYECTICRRSKSFLKDNQRVLLSQCMITKGCLGSLVPVGETNELRSTPSVEGVEDWYARGSVRGVESGVEVNPDFSFSTSRTGTLTLAVASSNPPSTLTLTFEQKRVGDVGFQQFYYKVTETMTSSGTTIITGRDSNSRNMRFDQTAINEGRIDVRVNGVTATPALVPNKITITPSLSVGDTVDVLVYAEKSNVTRSLVLTRNSSLMPSLVRGSWSNVDYVQRIVNGGGVLKWYLYSIDDIGSLTTGKIRVVGNDADSNAMFLLATSPFESMDRYLSFAVPQTLLQADFGLSHSNGNLIGPTTLLTELFPPLEIPTDSYIVPDLFTTDSVAADSVYTRIASKKILGPV